MATPEDTLEWIPRPVRTRLDDCRVRISLAQWQMLDLDARRALTTLATAGDDAAVFRAALDARLAAANAGPVRGEG